MLGGRENLFNMEGDFYLKCSLEAFVSLSESGFSPLYGGEIHPGGGLSSYS